MIHGERPNNPQVLFIKNVFDQSIYTLGTRLFTDILPSHLAENFIHDIQHHKIVSQIQAGQGSAPEYEFRATISNEKILPQEFSKFYQSWQDAVLHISHQDAAIAKMDDLKDLTYSDIHLNFDVDTIQALDVQYFQAGQLLHILGATQQPFAFLIPKLKFTVLSEQKIKRFNS